MENVKFLTILTLMSALLLLPGWSFAQYEEDGTVTGSVSVGAKAVSGDRESQKFQEYREIPRGVSGDVELQYKTNDKFFLELDAKNIAQDDQKLNVNAGRYGKYSLKFVYDQIPHRFALDAKTLFNGGGSGNLILSDLMQTTLQNTSTDAVGDLDANGTADQTADRNIAAANRIKDLMNAANVTDLQLFRKKTSLKLDVTSFRTVSWTLEWINEKRKGTRPIAGSFGFGNTIEIPEPIDYDTTQLKVGAEYAKSSLYLNVGAYVSVFKNNIDTVTWDNPFRITDSTNASAYAQSYAGGPAKGLHDLYPDNKYSNLSLTGSLMNMPMNGRLSLSAAWGWMQQDDPFVAYTTNTAIKTGAVTGGTAGETVPFNAYDKATLPKSSADAKVGTSLLNLTYTAHPSENLHLKAKYRVYKYENKTAQIKFPGYVRTEAVWEPVAVENLPSSYKKTTAGIDFDLAVSKATSLSLGYTLDAMQRTHREVSKSNEKIYNVSLLTKPADWLDIKTSYENSKRTGDYDYTVPFEGEVVTEQLPFLRKYDEANRKRDRLQFMATLYPSESFTLTGMVVVGKDNFMDSPFGLLEDKHSIYSLDADLAVTEKVDFYAFYTRENYKSLQKSRQWNPCDPATDTVTTVGCTGANEGADPYYVATGYDSPSNWTSENEDIVDTFGGGFKVAVKPEKVDFDLNYAYSKSDGQIKLESPLGASTNVDLNMVTPVNFNDVDDITTQTLKAKINYRLKKNLSLVFGYMWENFDVRDYNLVGFTTTPVNATGAYQGTLLMDSLLKNYDVHVVSAGISVKF